MRLIARLDVKNEFVIKGIHLEGLRKVGLPNELARKYYAAGVHEIVFMDAVASLYDRNNLFDVIKEACRDVFIPIAVGGGIRSVEDVRLALEAGADKVIINTGAIKHPKLITEIAKKFGSQCIVGSIEAKRVNDRWLAYTDNGREPTQLSVPEWSAELEKLGAGELLITSIDQEGTKRGFDIELIRRVHMNTNCPVIVSGGYGQAGHIADLLKQVVPGAVACASALHYDLESAETILGTMKTHLAQNSNALV